MAAQSHGYVAAKHSKQTTDCPSPSSGVRANGCLRKSAISAIEESRLRCPRCQARRRDEECTTPQQTTRVCLSATIITLYIYCVEHSDLGLFLVGLYNNGILLCRHGDIARKARALHISDQIETGRLY